ENWSGRLRDTIVAVALAPHAREGADPVMSVRQPPRDEANNAQSQRLRAACASNFRQTCRHAQADSQIDIAARRGISHSGRSTLGMDRRRRHAEYRFNHGAARFWADAFNIVERKVSEDRVIDASIAKRLYNGSPPKNHSARLTSESPRPRPETHR